ncbi:MAG: hypothetical protein NC338_07395 [Firmicutes bacterium]|nr:hypothetical protein [Bacillota bacterium]MCM1400977.1 hypothetical protein [Bacteroides sp.]MCM1476500.1 hypothetical protein [Bacteroides sp.]
MKATGVNDIRQLINNTLAEELTVAIAVEILRIAIPKAFGWVGAAVMLVEFADCLAHYNRYFEG